MKEEKYNGVGSYLGEVTSGVSVCYMKVKQGRILAALLKVSSFLQVRHGKGTFKWDNGDVYNGAWGSDAMNGYGFMPVTRHMDADQ